ncbi:hypothetical protein [Szabonella alba]|uniref:Uncharacterized protein n=1 Tax=Szabonella alba TaxID=2804194 RepID=A0A8K0VBB2_9RHOB|nr:hypothetical protein [Szabonella alba]MBL4919059.1 hypothetical protein [Szabonella alba]
MEDEGEDGAGLGLEGIQLKKFVKIARKQPLPFAFVPGTGDEEPTFMLHRRKKAEVMGKTLRKETGQSKVSFGMMSVEGKTVSLTCDKVVPGLGKKLQRFFRQQKVPMDVILLDAEGNEIS